MKNYVFQMLDSIGAFGGDRGPWPFSKWVLTAFSRSSLIEIL